MKVGGCFMKKKMLMMMILVFALMVTSCSPQTDEVKTTDVSENSTDATKTEATAEEDESIVSETDDSTDDEEKSIGFVMVGLGNEFFENLQKEFAARFSAMGWEVDVANGEFNPQTQITAMENFIAMEKDVIVLWAVSPEPLNTVAKQAMEAGIKVVAFVQPLEEYDACLLVDNTAFAESQVLMAAKWIDETFPDAEDRTVPVALITRDNVDSTKEQGDMLRKIEEYTSKAKLDNVIDNDVESTEAGMATTETIYTMNPDTKVYLTVNSAVALGVNNYFTAMSSPISDYSELGIFTLNGSGEIFEQIMLSKTDESPLRGTVMTGGVEATVDDIVKAAEGAMDGEFSDNHNIYGQDLFIFGNTIEEYLETGTVESVTRDSFK